MVVTEGDTVDFTLTNGSDASMKVDLPHSLDFHSAEVNPGTRYKDLAPGESMHYRFVAKHPGVIAFNGYANQYQQEPISVRKGEKVRMYVLNAGPSVWSAFHVIGTVFDRTVVEGTAGHDAQTIDLAPSQGGWVEFTLAEEGTFPFVNHAFGDMVKGSLGVLQTKHAPAA